MSDFKQATEAFLTWFTTRPGALFHQNIQLTDLRSKGEGRGIVATADIPTETELFTIPRSGILSTETSTLAKKLPHLLSTLKYAEGNSGKDDGDDDEDEEMVEMPDPWLDLILIMIYEYLQGDVSAWKLYFDVLPTEFDTPMFWESSELDELQASVVKDRIGKASADEMFTTKILPAVKGHEEVFYPSGVAKLSDEELVGLAHRMGSIIMAYAFDLDPEDDDEEDEEDGWVQDADVMKKMGMVPMADMLNADAEFNAHLNHEEEHLTMTSLRPIKAGEEILNYYGQLPNCDLLRRYGYTSTKHSRYDVVEIPWTLIKSTLDSHFGGPQASALDDEEIEQSFVLERESGDPDETGINDSKAEFVAFPEELEDQINQFTAPALKLSIDRPKKTDRALLKTAFAEIMTKVIPARLEQYATTVEQDEELLRKSETSGRLRMAVEVRLGEKKLLQEARAVADTLLEKYKPKEEEAVQQPRAAKRQKMSK